MLFINGIKKVDAEGIWSHPMYAQCDYCGRYILRIVTTANGWSYADYTVMQNGDVLCPTCRDELYNNGEITICEECGEYINTDEGIYNGRDGGMYCESCYEAMRADVIHPYEYKPDPIFHGAADLQAGIELEFCGYNPEEFASEYFDGDGENNYYFKEDGSVDLELVTHPRDYTSWKCYYSEMEHILAGARDYNMDDDDDNGCHIHLSRAGLGADAAEQELTIAKMIIFVNRHWDDVCMIAGRDSDDWAPCNGLPDDDDWSIETILQYSDDDRYYAVNIQNYATVELRIFNATCDTDTLYDYIEFAYSLAAYCMTHSVAECYNGDFQEVWN